MLSYWVLLITAVGSIFIYNELFLNLRQSQKEDERRKKAIRRERQKREFEAAMRRVDLEILRERAEEEARLIRQVQKSRKWSEDFKSTEEEAMERLEEFYNLEIASGGLGIIGRRK